MNQNFIYIYKVNTKFRESGKQNLRIKEYNSNFNIPSIGRHKNLGY